MSNHDIVKNEEKKINSHDFYFETSLYNWIKIENLEDNVFNSDVDAYSSKNHIPTTYSIKTDLGSPIIWRGIMNIRNNYICSGFFEIELTCKRKVWDNLFFFVYVTENEIIKVGQFPSLADIQFSKLWKKYDKILPQEDLKNLKKAIWLYSHWAWAGSFVYLRRIFENLVFDTFEKNKESLDILLEEFNIKRMEDKVLFLSEFLPEQLVSMRKLYSILSKGVHELTEEECLKYFEPMKFSIELILDQKIEMMKKSQKDEQAKKTIDSILQDLS